MQKISKSVYAFLGFVLLVGFTFWYFNLIQYFSLTTLQQHLTYFRTALNNCYWCVLGIYCAVYTILAACMVPVVGPVTLVGGYLFGGLIGFATSMAALLAGLSISFSVIRYLSASWLPARWQVRREKFAARIKEHGAWYIFILNIVTVVPFLAITTLAALSEISLWKFVVASLLGSSPMILMYAFAGRQLADITSLGQLFSPGFIGMLLLLISLSFIPLIIKRFTRMSIDDV